MLKLRDCNIDVVENFISSLDKIGITRDPHDDTWQWGGKGDFPTESISELVKLHGGNADDVAK